MKTISVANQKGGVGKTTSVINIGAGLRRLGKRVLLIDLDPQSNLTYSLGLTRKIDKTVLDILKGEARAGEVVIDKDGLYIIPSSIDLAGADIELSTIAGREFLLKEALRDVKGMDYIFIDCPPSLGLLTLNAFTVSDEVYIPLQTEYLALQGLNALIKTIDLIKTRINGNLNITGVIATRYDKRKILNKEVAEAIKNKFKDKLFNTYIRENISLAEAPSFGQDIFTYRPNSNGAEDYLNLCKEIIERS
ncbi:MAG: ParA family protein [Candidatus Humimicrobiaceae bacterium]